MVMDAAMVNEIPASVILLPQIYPTLIISDLYSYGTKMFPQFE